MLSLTVEFLVCNKDSGRIKMFGTGLKPRPARGRPIIDVAAEMTDIDRTELEKLLEPGHLTPGGIGQ